MTGGVNIPANGGLVEGLQGVLIGRGNFGSVGTGTVGTGSVGTGTVGTGTVGIPGRPVDGAVGRGIVGTGGKGGNDGNGRVVGKAGIPGKNKSWRAAVVRMSPENTATVSREKMMRVVEAISAGGKNDGLGRDYI
ncbi:hypothetical protein R6Q57_019349 [Mikania cordata]